MVNIIGKTYTTTSSFSFKAAKMTWHLPFNLWWQTLRPTVIKIKKAKNRAKHLSWLFAMVTLSKSNDNELEQTHFPNLSRIKVTSCKGIYVRLKFATKKQNLTWTATRPSIQAFEDVSEDYLTVAATLSKIKAWATELKMEFSLFFTITSAQFNEIWWNIQSWFLRGCSISFVCHHVITSRGVPKREYLMLKNSPFLNWEKAPFLQEPAIKKNAQL